MLPPEPVRTRIGLPTVEPVTGATPNAQVVAPPDVPSATRTVSRTPSPFGEITPPLAEAEVTVGATVSIVTQYVDQASARNVVDGL